MEGFWVVVIFLVALLLLCVYVLKAEFVHSKFLKTSILKCPSSVYPGRFYLFTVMKHSKHGEKSYFACSECRKITKRGTISRVTVSWENKEKQIGTVISDPDANHVAGCIPKTMEMITGKELEKEVFLNVRNGKRPSDSHHAVQSSITKRARDGNLDETAIIMNFRDKFEMNRQLQRHQQFGIPRIDDPFNLPPCYRITHQSKHSSGTPERWLLYQNKDSGTLIFASDQDLNVLSQSPIWFADGTFKMCPKEFAQLYCLHVEYLGEPMPIMYCFLTGKTEPIYREVFQTLMLHLNRILPAGTPIRATDMMMDFETAERNAFKLFFPNIRVRGCSFHFGQALLRKIGQIGLKLQYSDSESLVHSYVRHLLALPFLPTFLVLDAWHFYLQYPLNLAATLGIPIPDANTLNILSDFSRYFSATWLSRCYEWNHSDNNSHRTNNIPEAFHSKFSRGFGHVHSSLHHVLNYIQELQYEYRCRQIKLLAGYPAKPKNEKYQILVVYGNIHAEK